MDQTTRYYEQGHTDYSSESNLMVNGEIGDSRLSNICDEVRAKLKPGAKILDVGCGDLFLAKLMPEFNWTGLDLSPRGPREGQITKHDITLFPYPYEDDSFDLVVCSEVLEHLFDPGSVLKECLRLAPILILTVPNYNALERLAGQQDKFAIYNPESLMSIEHIRNYTPESMTLLVEKCGWKSLGIVGNSPQMGSACWYAVVALAKYTNLNSLDAAKLVGRMLPAFCPGFLMLCERVHASN